MVYILNKFRPDQLNELKYISTGVTQTLLKHPGIRGYLLMLAMLQGVVHRIPGQTPEKITADLVRSGFENVRCIIGDEKCYLSLENNIYRWDIMAIYKALDIIASDLDKSVEINLLVLENGVPQKLISVNMNDWKNFTLGYMDPVEFKERISVSHKTSGISGILKKVKALNRSVNKFDLVIYPQFYFENTLTYKFYNTQINLAPALEFSLWKGNRFTGQVIFPIHNNLGYEGDHIRPGIVSISQEFRLSDNLNSTITAGNLPGNIYGIASETNLLLFSGRFSLGLTCGVIGSSYFLDGEWVHSPIDRFTSSLSASWFWSHFNMELKAGGARYVNEDYGLFAKCTRFFNETSVGLYAQIGEFGNNGGFYFSIPLPFKKRYNRRFFRITIPEQYGFSYNAGTYNYYGQSISTVPNSIYKDRLFWNESIKNMITNLKNNIK